MGVKITVREDILKGYLEESIKGETTVSITPERTKVTVATFARNFVYTVPTDMTNAISLELMALACAICEHHVNRVTELYFK